MNKNPRLTEAQQATLQLARQHNGSLDHAPPKLTGVARQRVLDALIVKRMIVIEGAGHRMTDAGYAAIGCTPPKAIKRRQKTKPVTPSATTERQPREASKQAQVVAMLRREQGATLAELCELTQWQPHTVRGAMSGALRKKLGLDVTSEKPAGEARIYRIA